MCPAALPSPIHVGSSLTAEKATWVADTAVGTTRLLRADPSGSIIAAGSVEGATSSVSIPT